MNNARAIRGELLRKQRAMTPDCERKDEPMSQEYHDAHLAFARAAIVEAAANRQPILDRLHIYTADVVKAERDARARSQTGLR